MSLLCSNFKAKGFLFFKSGVVGIFQESQRVVGAFLLGGGGGEGGGITKRRKKRHIINE